MTSNLFLIFHGRFPSEKAASLFTALNAESFSSEGMKVTLIVPKRKGMVSGDPYSYYGVRNNFQIEYIPVWDLFGSVLPHKISFWISMITFSRGVAKYLKKVSSPDDIIYSNEILPLFYSSFFRKNCFYEMHDFPESKLSLFSFFLKRMKWVLVHNTWKLEKILKSFPALPSNKFLNEPNAVDISMFDIPLTKEAAREELKLPKDKTIFLYTGHLYGWKGVDTLALAMKKLSDKYLAVFVGGTDKDVAAFRKKYALQKNILIVGFRKHAEMPVWQKAADACVLPNTAKEAISAFYTSPMKLYEYMASKRLVVASDLPSVREIVGEKAAILVKPDDPEALQDALERATRDSSLSETYVENAFALVRDHTWTKRAQRIIVFIKSHA